MPVRRQCRWRIGCSTYGEVWDRRCVRTHATEKIYKIALEFTPEHRPDGTISRHVHVWYTQMGAFTVRQHKGNEYSSQPEVADITPAANKCQPRTAVR